MRFGVKGQGLEPFRVRAKWLGSEVAVSIMRGYASLSPGGQACQHLGASQQPLLTHPPLTQAVLAAAIIVNLKGMLMQFTDIRSLWKSNRMDLVRGLRAPVLLLPVLLLNPHGLPPGLLGS